MANENKTILLKLDLDTSGLVKQSEEASKQLTILKERQKELRQSGQENSVEYARLKEEIRLTTKELNTSASALLISEKQNGKTKQSVNDLMQVQKVLSVQFNNLTLEEIENSEAGKKIAEQYKEVNDALNKNSQSVGDGRRNVGLYKQSIIEANKEIKGLKVEINQIGFAYGKTKSASDEATASLNKMSASGQQNTEAFVKLENEVKDLNETLTFQESALKGANQELKKQEEQLAETEKEARKIGFVYNQNEKSVSDLRNELKEMQDVMSRTDANSEEYIQASVRAGELRDKLKEVKENTNALAGGSGFEKMGNTMGALKDDLLNLDFEGVSEKAKTLQKISSGMTFKEVTGGLKSMGSALLSLGKTILMNPLFLLAGVVAGIVGALIYFSQEEATAEAETEKFNKQLERNNLAFERNNNLIQRNAQFQIDLAKARGEGASKILKLELESLEKGEEARRQEINNRRMAIAGMIENHRLANRQENFELALKIAEQITAEKDKIQELKDQNGAYWNERKLIEINGLKAIQDERKKDIDKIIQNNERKIQLEIEIVQRIRDLQLSTLELTASQQRQTIEAEYNFRKKYIDLTIEDDVEKNQKLLELEIQKNERIRQIDEEEKLNAIERIKDQSKKEQVESKGTAEQIKIQNSEIKKQEKLQLQQIDVEFKQKEKEREQVLVELQNKLSEAKVQAVIQTNEEILSEMETALINQETSLSEAGKTEIEISSETARQRIEIERQKNKTIQEDKNKSDEEKRRSEAEMNAKIFDINKANADAEIQLELEKQKELKAIQEASIQAVSDISNAFFEVAQRNIAEEMQAFQDSSEMKQQSLQNQLDAGSISQEEFNQQKLELDKKLKSEEAKLNKKAFETQKQSAIVQATIQTSVAVAESLPNIILAGITAGLGAIQIGLIASQQAPAFASGGKVLSGQRIGSNDGKTIFRPNGDNLLASVKVGEVILNQSQQALLGGEETFRRLGINGFAEGGLVGSGIVGGQIASEIISSAETSNLILRAVKNLPSPVVVIQDVVEASNNIISIENSANI